jgi:hypothetical protein
MSIKFRLQQIKVVENATPIDFGIAGIEFEMD